MEQTVYQQNGFETRRAYLQSLPDQFGVSLSTVFTLASLLGPSEDFDGLITSLEDAEGMEGLD